DPSPVVRLYLACALQRLPLEKRWPIAEELVRHAEDATDANLPLMLWYAIEPLVPTNPTKAMGLVLNSKVPLMRQFIARRATDDAVAQGDKGDFTPLVSVLMLADEESALDVLKGVCEGIRGRKSLKMPDGWPAVYAKLSKSKEAVRDHATVVALVF